MKISNTMASWQNVKDIRGFAAVANVLMLDSLTFSTELDSTVPIQRQILVINLIMEFYIVRRSAGLYP